MNYLKLAIIYLVAISIQLSYGQDLLEDLSTSGSLGDQAEIFSEKIINIGRSQKVFILTNTNSMLNKGDFITFIIQERDAAARAVVAKNHDSLVGAKILKIYSLKNWAKIYKGMDIKILKGDDSFLFAKKVETDEDATKKDKIKNEEDLYAEELALEENSNDDFSNDNRLIKPDNIVSLGFGRFTFSDNSSDNQSVGGYEFSGGWAYQFNDNYWVEALGTGLFISDYPDNGDKTAITRLTFRLKYTIALPLYAYLLPYIGYQQNLVSSPNAKTNQEREDVKKFGEAKFAFGATILKRLVPGWFLKVDLGTDLINIGAAIEF